MVSAITGAAAGPARALRQLGESFGWRAKSHGRDPKSLKVKISRGHNFKADQTKYNSLSFLRVRPYDAPAALAAAVSVVTESTVCAQMGYNLYP